MLRLAALLLVALSSTALHGQIAPAMVNKPDVPFGVGVHRKFSERLS
jgi:hypothetical protein